MAIYIVVLIFFALALLFAYKSFGGEPASDDQVSEFVGNVRGWVIADAARVIFLTGNKPITEGDEDVARDVRKKLTGYQQQINRLLPNPDERDHLSLAIESLNWACRMTESGSCRVNHGVRQSAQALFAYANSLLSEHN